MSPGESSPPPAALVWLRDREHGGRPALTEEKIVRTAIDIADREGIDALSMRRIAAELNSGTTSLYRHLTSKDELIELMIDTVFGEQPPPEQPEGDWRDELAGIARRFRGTLLRHPWMAQQASRRPALGPNVIARNNHGLGVIFRATDDATLAAMVMDSVTTYVLGSVNAELAQLETMRRTGMSVDDWRRSVGVYVKQVVDSGRYPHFNRRILDAEDSDAETRFEFGLDCLLTGIAAAIGA